MKTIRGFVLIASGMRAAQQQAPAAAELLAAREHT